jgi:alkylhydroperoxidase family enzyme
MHYLPISGLPVIEPEEADPEVAQLYADMQQQAGLSFVNNSNKSMGSSPAVLTIYRDMLQTFYTHLTLPESLIPMILYTIASARNCVYCSVINGSFCRTLGVDDETLEKLAHDLGNVSPQRLRVIIEFAVKCSQNPQGLVAEDYELVREQGVSDDELLQIIFLAALGNFNDTLADSIKAEPDAAFLEASGQ